MSSTAGRIRVLLLAEAANPQWTSVPLVGWSHSQAIARRADVHLVTQVRNREAIAATGLVEGRDFTAIDSERVAKRAYQLGRLLGARDGKGWTTQMAIVALAYGDFEKRVWQRFGNDIRAGRFDVVHRLTPLSPTVPSRLAVKCARAGVPFVLGPLNGGVPWPWQFDAARRKEREWLTYLRGAYRLMPGFWSTRRAAAAILIGSRHTLAQTPVRYRDKCIYMPENAIDPARFSRRKVPGSIPGAADASPRRPLRAVFVGRLVPYKGCDMLIEAAATLLRSGELQLTIVGDGPQLGELMALAARLNVSEAVTFRGRLPHAQVQHELVEADVFTFPSIREFGGGAVVEAMAVGVAPVVVDYAGPAEIVTPDTGYLVPLGSRPQIVAALAATLQGVVSDPSQLVDKAQRAYERAHQLFTWDVRAAQVCEVYDWVLGRRAQRPTFEFGVSEHVRA